MFSSPRHLHPVPAGLFSYTEVLNYWGMPNLPRRPSQTLSLPAQAPPAAGDHDLEDPQPPMLCAPGAELCLVGKRALKVKVSCRWIGYNCSSLKGGELYSISPVHDELADTPCRTQTNKSWTMVQSQPGFSQSLSQSQRGFLCLSRHSQSPCSPD